MATGNCPICGEQKNIRFTCGNCFNKYFLKKSDEYRSKHKKDKDFSDEQWIKYIESLVTQEVRKRKLSQL